MDLGLKGKTALITGGEKGIGAGCCIDIGRGGRGCCLLRPKNRTGAGLDARTHSQARREGLSNVGGCGQ